MNRHLLLFTGLLILSFSSFSQIEPMIKYYTEEKVLKTFYKQEKKNEEQESKYKLSDTKSGDTLILKIEGYENITIKFTFGLESGYCDYQSLEFSCDSCSLAHSEEILNLKYCGWRKLREDSYLSKYTIQTQMQMIMIGNLCRKIIYKYVDKPKKIYKSEYNSLTKII